MVTKRQKAASELRNMAGGRGKAAPPAPAGVKRVGVYMTPELHLAAKRRALDNAETLSDLVRRAVERELTGGA